MESLFKCTLSEVCILIIEIFCIFGILLFAASAITTNINFGNIVGMLMCAFGFVICIKRDALTKIIQQMWDNTAGKVIIIITAAIIAVCIITAAVLSVFMISRINRLPEEKTDTVIVLGCRVKENAPSLMLEKRILAAYEYLADNPTSVCIASGGKGVDEPISEAECIRNRLVEMGISSDRIILEEKSTNTYENILNSKAIMDELGYSPSAVIVTSEFHQFRASIIAGKQGIEAYNHSSPTQWLLLPSYWIREWFAILNELLLK